MVSVRVGVAEVGCWPFNDRTKATNCQIWYSGTRSPQAGIPLGRPLTIVSNRLAGSPP